MNRTPSITTRTHASISLGGPDESHIHIHVAVESVVGLAFGTNVVSPMILSSTIRSILDNRIMISNGIIISMSYTYMYLKLLNLFYPLLKLLL